MISDYEWKVLNELGMFDVPIIRLWSRTWEMVVKQQRHYSLLMLVRGISCLMMRYNRMIETPTEQLDPRISMIYFSDSGSGKGLGSSFYSEVFGQHGVGLKIRMLRKPTPEKLVGSFNEKINERNIMKSYSSDNEKWRDPIIHGFLETCEDIIFDESHMFFNTQDYGEEILRIARLALDTYQSPNNYMTSETLKNSFDYGYYTKCNVCFLSYHIENISKQILSNGIFQRTNSMFYHLGRKEMEDILTSPSKSILAAVDRNKREIVLMLNTVKEHIQNMSCNIQIMPDAVSYTETELKTMLGDIYKDEDTGKLIQSFLPRLRVNIYKTAATLAMLRKSSHVSVQEIKEAIYIVISLGFKSMERELITFGIVAQEQKQWYTDLRYTLGHDIRSKSDIPTVIAAKWGVSRPTAINRLKKLKDLFIEVNMKEKGKPNLHMCKLK